MKNYLIIITAAAAILSACSAPTPAAGRAFAAECRFGVEWHYVETRRPAGATRECTGVDAGAGEVDALRAACAADGGRMLVIPAGRYTTAECS